MSNSQAQTPAPERTLRTRNPRRRQRNDEDSVKTAPRRKRSKLSEETFTSRVDEELNGHAAMNGSVKPARTAHTSTPPVEMEMPVRSKKKASERHRRADGAVVLTQNQCYSVKLLPSTPKELRGKDVQYRANVCTSKSRALAITHTHAHIWDYTVHSTATTVRTFEVPFHNKDSDPLPFGALVTTGASPEIGLVLISATNGNVVYYDSIERAASLSIFPDRAAGVNGSLGGIFSSEQVADVVAADHAGFVVTLSSGRLVQLTLRDAQGKPKIQAQVLRTNEQSQGGWFGSVKGFLSTGAWKQDVCTARTRAMGTKGQMQVVGLTESAQLRIWDLDWSGHHVYRGTVDFREQMYDELKSEESAETQGRAEQFVVLDFALLDHSQSAKGREVATSGAEQPLDIVTLVSTGYGADRQYSLINISVRGDQVDITRMVQLRKYRGTSGTTRPTIRLPKPGHTAYAVFEDAVVLVAMADVDMESPEAQLHGSLLSPEPFQDPVYLRHEQGLAMLGTREEESRGGQASLLAFVKSSGLVRFSAVDPIGDVERAQIPVKNKIEQAVFHGMMHENPIDFQRAYAEAAYPSASVEDAALSISREVLSSESSYIMAPATFVEAHLSQRAQALQCLIVHLLRHHRALSRPTVWRLLWDAEKVAAAQTMWQKYERHYEAATKGKRRQTLFEAVCDHLQERFKFDPADEADEDDLVRRFFIRGLDRLEKALPAIFNTVEILRGDGKQAADEKVLRLIHEADDLWLGALNTVHAFREERADAYGISPETLKDGILTNVQDYQDLPEIWTSSKAVLSSISKLASMVRETAQTSYEIAARGNASEMAANLGKEAPSLVELCCLTYQEKILSCAASSRVGDRKLAEQLQTQFDHDRNVLFRELAGVGQTEPAMRLCEKYKDMETLTEVVIGEMDFMREEEATLGDDGQAVLQQNIAALQANIGRYFQEYDEEWSVPFFDHGLSKSNAGSLFELAQKHWQAHLTRYLRGNPARAKLCWVNDINVDSNYDHAAQSLKTAAAQEQSLWAQGVEYSMARLALLAAQEEAVSEEAPPPTSPELLIIREQGNLVDLLRDSLATATDDQAVKQVIMEDYGRSVSSKTPTLREQLASGFNDLMSEHKALSLEDLIDVLTLMDHVHLPTEGESNETLFWSASEFCMALRILNAGSRIYQPERISNLLHLVWKRCWLADDWAQINRTIKSEKLEGENLSIKIGGTKAFATICLGYQTGIFSNDAVRPLFPADCIGAASSTEELRSRFGAEAPDALVVGLARDNQVQDEMLLSCVEKHGLKNWAEVAVEEARGWAVMRQRKAVEQEEELAAFVRKFGESGVVGEGEDEVDGFGNGVKREDTEGEGVYLKGNGVKGVSAVEDSVQAEDGDEDVEMQ